MAISKDRKWAISLSPLSVWLLGVCLFIIIMVVYGGFVRLTNSGLSMVEWHVVTGVVPPIGDAAWAEAFAKYQQSPEYKQINYAMSLARYQSIYYVEYIHRILGRLAGLLYVVPMFIFLMKGTIPWRKSGVYLVIGLLFALQGFMGWYMVQSGLIDEPRVSHYRLTVHLLLAVLVLGLTFWTALNVLQPSVRREQAGDTTVSRLAIALLVLVVIQIGSGALVAGLKAGYVSSTFPTMFGYLIPPNLFSAETTWIQSLVDNPVTVHFMHRWFAFAVLIFGILLFFTVRKKGSRIIQKAVSVLLGLLSIQLLLGIAVIYWQVPLAMALIHQAVAMVTFMAVLYINYQLTISN